MSPSDIVHRNLKTLINHRFRQLSQKHGRSGSAGRSSARQAASAALRKIIQDEMVLNLNEFFGASPQKNGSGERISQPGGRCFDGGSGVFSLVDRDRGGRGCCCSGGSEVWNGGGERGGRQRSLEILIDQMVAESLTRGRHTSGVLRALFGIVPSLIGR